MSPSAISSSMEICRSGNVASQASTRATSSAAPAGWSCCGKARLWRTKSSLRRSATSRGVALVVGLRSSDGPAPCSLQGWWSGTRPPGWRQGWPGRRRRHRGGRGRAGSRRGPHDAGWRRSGQASGSSFPPCVASVTAAGHGFAVATVLVLRLRMGVAPVTMHPEMRDQMNAHPGACDGPAAGPCTEALQQSCPPRHLDGLGNTR